MNITRDEVYWIHNDTNGVHEGSEQGGTRPAVVVSNDICNRFSPVVEVVYLTTKHKPELPTHVTIHSLPEKSVALCEQITSVARNRLEGRINNLTDAEMRQIDAALVVSLGLEGRRIVVTPRTVTAGTPIPR